MAWIPIKYNLRSMKARIIPTLVAMSGIAGVVAVFLAMLSMARGFLETVKTAGVPDNAIVLKAGGTLDLNGLTFNQGWTTTGRAFQGVFFESPNIVSAAPVSVLSNNLNWTNFSTLPKGHYRVWTLVQKPDGTSQYAPADSVAPHVNTYSVLIEAAANGLCWVCMVNSTPVNVQ